MNDLENLTNEQRQALVRYLLIGTADLDKLVGTKYVAAAPDGRLELTVEARRDYNRLRGSHRGITTAGVITNLLMIPPEEEFHPLDNTVDALDINTSKDAAEILRTSITPSELLKRATAPFTPDQERRIREIVAEALMDAVRKVVLP